MIDDTSKEVTPEVAADVVAADVVAADVVAADVVAAKPEEKAPELTIQDLVQLRNILKIASERSAFRAEEFTVVGATFDKLNGFVNSVMPQLEAAHKAEEEAQAAASQVAGE